MPSYFRRTRCVELSTLEYLERVIGNSWSGVTVIKSFQQAYDEAVPVVCIRLLDTDSSNLEIGATTLRHSYTITIDIFAKSDAQRLDLADFIMDQLRVGWTYSDYAHNSGRTDIVATPNGRVTFEGITQNTKIDFGVAGDSQDRFRHFISCLVGKW